MSIARLSLHAAADALAALRADEAAIGMIDTVGSDLAAAIAGGGKLMICGNGGSSCDANHFAEELTGRFRDNRPPLPALACTDVGHITCTANDYGYDHIFSRWVDALGNAGDRLIVLSTSGNSRTITNAVLAAKARKMRTVALLGKDGGKCKGLADLEIIVPGHTTDRIQELHMLILHIWCEMLEPARR
jgi:D-sedoheptulose 7-phosphate isomerase